MSSRSDRLFASTSFRLSALYAALLVVAFVVASTWAWVATQSMAEHQIRDRVQLEMDSLQREIRSEGIAAAVAAIQTRSARPGALEYRLSDAHGRVLAGNLTNVSPTTGWATLQEAEEAGERPEAFLVLTQTTSDAGVLSIGDDFGRSERIRFALFRTLLWVGLATVVLALGAGVFLARRALARVDALTRTMGLVSAGDLSARMPRSSRVDDLELLARGINAMLDQIDALVANVRRVSTDIAHDLRTPLTHVRQQLESGAQATDLAASHDAMRAAQNKIDEVLRIFQAMLRLSEIEAGSGRARFAPVDLAALVERITDAYRPDIEASGRTLGVETLTPTSVEGDADLLAQALANLIENAMEHTPPGTTIRVSLVNAGDQIQLAVEDKGVGIEQEDRARAVQPFVRLSQSRSGRGAGLGLAIVSATAQLHGAELLLEGANPGLRAVIQWSH